MQSDNRKFSRVPFEVEAELTVGNRSFRVNEIMNLGMGGCLLPSGTEFETGTVCRVLILLDSSDSKIRIEISGKIKRSAPGTVAVQFTRIDPDSLFHLRNIVRHNCPEADVVDRESSKHPGVR